MERMTKSQRVALQKRVKKIVDADGLMATAAKIPIGYATLRRFLGGQPMHESTLGQIERALAS